MEQETIVISKQEFEALKNKAGLDEELLQELIQGLKDIKSGNVKRVK